MSEALNKIAKLTDEQLVESIELLKDASRDDLRFYYEALQKEHERRHGTVYGEDEG